MVMGDDDVPGPKQQGVPEDDLCIDQCAILCARSYQLEPNDVVRHIEHKQDEMFLVIIQCRIDGPQNLVDIIGIAHCLHCPLGIGQNRLVDPQHNRFEPLCINRIDVRKVFHGCRLCH